MADPVTNWVDARIQVGVKAAVDAALEHEDEMIAKFATAFRNAILGDFTVVSQKVAEIPEAIPPLITSGLQVVQAGLQGLEAIPQQTAAQMEQLIATLPAQIAQAIGGLFPHFLRHLATLPPTERDTLVHQYAATAVETPDDLAEHRKRVRDPEE